MIEEALLSIGLLILATKLAEAVFKRFHVNSIVAYTVVGILLGPVTGIVEPTSEMQILLGIGIFLLFFLIGLDELDFPSFVAAFRGRFVVAAVISVLVPMLAIMAVTSDVVYDFGLGLDFTESICLAGILSLTSLGRVGKVLVDGGHRREPIGIRIFTTALMAEMLALLLVGFTIGEHTHQLSWSGVLILLGQIVAFAMVTWVLASRVMPALIVLLKRFLHVPQLSFGLILGGLFLTVSGAEKMGLHGSLGALLFGSALSGLPFQVRRDIVPGMRSIAEGFFIPLFFAAAGLHLSLSFIELPILTIAALVIVPFVGKFAGALLGAYVTRQDMPFTLATGLMAKGVAEIALLLVLFETGAIDPSVFSLLVLIMVAYILLVPPGINAAIRRAEPSQQAASSVPELPSLAHLDFALDDITVGDILDRSRTYPDASQSVRAFVDRWVIPHQQDYLLVEQGRLLGIVSLGMLRYLPKKLWSSTRVGKFARQDPPCVHPNEPVEDALQKMTEHSLTVMPVLDAKSEEFLGMVTSQEVLDLMILEARGEH